MAFTESQLIPLIIAETPSRRTLRARFVSDEDWPEPTAGNSWGGEIADDYGGHFGGGSSVPVSEDYAREILTWDKI